MATTLRDVWCRAACLGLGFTAVGQQAQAQSAPPTQAQVSAGLGAVVSPTLSTQVTHSDNAALAPDQSKQSDTIVSVSPGVSVQYRSANTTITGQMRLSSVSYLQHTASSQVVPNGNLRLRTDVARQGVGLDANVSADQVKSQFTSATSASASTADTYTNTRVYISPFVERPLDAQTRLSARLERTQLHTTANGDGLSNRPDTNSNAASLVVSRRPTRLGYAIEGRYQDSQTSGSLPSINTQRLIRGKALYALTQELELGLVVGRESNQILQQRTQGTTKGLQVDWRPNERAQFKVLVEDRFFGRSWNGDLAYRSPSVTFGLISTRQLDNYTTSTGANNSASGGSTQALLDAMLTTRIPNEAERAKAVRDLITQRNLPLQLGSGRDLYDLNTLLRQNLAVRAAFMGVRSVALVSIGQNRAKPISTNAVSSLLGAGNDTRERYLDAQFNHRLTPMSTVTAGFRLGRARAIGSLLNTETRSRDQGFRVSFATALSPRTQVVWGLRRQRTVTEATTGTPDKTITENVMFAGLEHRF